MKAQVECFTVSDWFVLKSANAKIEELSLSISSEKSLNVNAVE